MEVTAKPKKWGNSIGIIIPKEVVDLEKITTDDELVVHIEKKKDREKAKLMREGYIEMKDELFKTNKDWEKADSEWP
jgi:antitoxin component of MazEF toxin-antitoxin module